MSDLAEKLEPPAEQRDHIARCNLAQLYLRWGEQWLEVESDKQRVTILVGADHRDLRPGRIVVKATMDEGVIERWRVTSVTGSVGTGISLELIEILHGMISARSGA